MAPMSPRSGSHLHPGLHLVLIGALALPFARPAAGGEAAKTPCALPEIPGGIVAAVTDGRNFVLADGRDIRLAAIETPRPGAKAALAELIAGKTVLLKGRPQPDRYGRLVAFTSVSGSETPVQYALLARGEARFAGPAEDKDCAAALLRQESLARAGRLGLWGDPVYAIRQSGLPAAILSGRGRFAVVEGRVLSVRESGATIYVNFGRRWSEDFTVTIAKRNERAFVASGLEPKMLAGRDVRVRGWVEERGGPLIEATHAGQIEIAERFVQKE